MDAYLDFALNDPHRFDAAFLLPARGARRYPDDFTAGRSPAATQIFRRIEAAKAEGVLIDIPPLEIVLTISALAQGFVSMHRAQRFSDEASLRTLYRAALRHAVASFLSKGPR
jgi:hypothetical protein